MKMKNRILKWLLTTIMLLLALIFVAKFGGPTFLQNYIKAGIGDCTSIPILCKSPEGEIIVSETNNTYLQECIPYKFPKVELCAPKGFKIVQELIKKPYYTKRKPRNGEPVIYLLHQPAGYFTKLYPNLNKVGITDNYTFLNSVMSAKVNHIDNVTDAFFVIMKGIFIPDLGDQNKAIMTKFKLKDKKGFLNYNLGDKNNYFDCSIVDGKGEFFKIYIRDTQVKLDLDKVFTIISTITNGQQKA